MNGNENKIDGLSAAVIDAIKAECARIGMDGKTLAEKIGKDRNYVYARFRHQRVFDTNDIDRIANALGLTDAYIFKQAETGIALHPDIYMTTAA